VTGHRIAGLWDALTGSVSPIGRFCSLLQFIVRLVQQLLCVSGMTLHIPFIGLLGVGDLLVGLRSKSLRRGQVWVFVGVHITRGLGYGQSAGNQTGGDDGSKHESANLHWCFLRNDDYRKRRKPGKKKVDRFVERRHRFYISAYNASGPKWAYISLVMDGLRKVHHVEAKEMRKRCVQLRAS
jgi:hypothetical protein